MTSDSPDSDTTGKTAADTTSVVEEQTVNKHDAARWTNTGVIVSRQPANTFSYVFVYYLKLFHNDGSKGQAVYFRGNNSRAYVRMDGPVEARFQYYFTSPGSGRAEIWGQFHHSGDTKVGDFRY